MQHKGGEKGVDCSLQVGDMGIGFKNNFPDSKDGKSWPPEIDTNHKWIKGNHDDPTLCKQHPNYIGDYGFLEKSNIFFVSGGYSIDHSFRTKNIDWWEDEELNEKEMITVLEYYETYKPKIVVTHECPLSLKKEVVTNERKLEYDSRTEKLLQNMYDIHQPCYWVFGHHHKHKEIDKNGTHFVCLDELMYGKINDCIYEIKGLTWEGYK